LSSFGDLIGDVLDFVFDLIPPIVWDFGSVAEMTPPIVGVEESEP